VTAGVAELSRCNVLGVGVHAVNMESAVATLERMVRDGRRGYVCVTGVHGVMEAQADPEFRATLNRAALNVPDGMPMVWVGRCQRHRDMRRVYGPDLMAAICEASRDGAYRHFLYGGNQGIAQELKERLEQRFPGIRIVGTFTPPFRPLNPDEEEALRRQVQDARPDFFWVGLSTPKQEAFMARYLPRLDATVMLGVGAAFDIHTGHHKDAPDWMKRAGLQWFHRLCQDPARLWKRYLYNNPRFVHRLLLQMLGWRKYPLD
jgi:N-acetylglucosaminyldiphosphoundecaprenol N-acetyl-beta-D-mannosaminyltransferase